MADKPMPRKTKAGCVLGILSLLVRQPIWYWLLYQILVRVQATDLMWFLYWIYVPFSLLIGILFKISDAVFDEK